MVPGRAGSSNDDSAITTEVAMDLPDLNLLLSGFLAATPLALRPIPRLSRELPDCLRASRHLNHLACRHKPDTATAPWRVGGLPESGSVSFRRGPRRRSQPRYSRKRNSMTIHNPKELFVMM